MSSALNQFDESGDLQITIFIPGELDERTRIGRLDKPIRHLLDEEDDYYTLDIDQVDGVPGGQIRITIAGVTAATIQPVIRHLVQVGTSKQSTIAIDHHDSTLQTTLGELSVGMADE